MVLRLDVINAVSARGNRADEAGVRKMPHEKEASCHSLTGNFARYGMRCGQKVPGVADSLRVTRIKHLRGIRDLRVPFPYPVCVLAGPNGCGKSTVLFACACAYQDPDRGPRDFAPSSLFPMTTSSSAETPGATSFQATSEPWESSAS